MIHLETAFKVDVFLLKQRPFDQNQMRRRILQPCGQIPNSGQLDETLVTGLWQEYQVTLAYR